MMANRKEGAEQINNLFGLDVSVELSSSWKQNKKEQEMILNQDKQEQDKPEEKDGKEGD